MLMPTSSIMRPAVTCFFLWAILHMGTPVSARSLPPVDAPQFSDYPVSQHDRPHASGRIRLRLDSAQTRRHTTVLHEAFTLPANFAGHLRVALWGCGTDCRNFAILDKNTGAAYTLPDVGSITGIMGNEDERVDFRLDSRMLVISGCFNDDCFSDNAKAHKYYYLWTGKSLRLIRTTPLTIQPVDTGPAF